MQHPAVARAFAIVSGLISIGVALQRWMAATQLGFPDGHLTALDGMNRYLYLAVVVVSIVASLRFLQLSLTSTQYSPARRVAGTAAVYLGFLVLMAAVERFAYIFLSHGQGG